MLGEIVHLQSVLDELREQTKDPLDLPPASEQVILDVKGQENQFTYVSKQETTCTKNLCTHILAPVMFHGKAGVGLGLRKLVRELD